VYVPLLSTGATARYGAFFGQGSGPIFLADLFCSGIESSLLDCNRNIYGVTHCQHYEDAGVECQGHTILPCTKFIFACCSSLGKPTPGAEITAYDYVLQP